MLPSGVALRHVVAAVAAACTGSFLLMDCNPSLYWYDRFLQVTAPSPRQRGQDSITSAASAAASVNGAVRSSSCRTVRAGGYHNFQDIKCVWIVGASSGIGREMAEQLAVSGVQHLVLSSRSAGKCNAVAVSCRQLNPVCRLTVLPVNVCDSGELERAVQDIVNLPDTPPLDMVVMNAGVGQLLPALETDAATTEHIVRSNALWPMILTPLLFAKTSSSSSSSSSPQQSQPPPHLVVTSSIAGKLAVPLSAAYAASKFAIQGYFSSLACERPDLRIDLLCPGPVDTEFHRNNNDSNNNDEPKAPSKMKMPVDRCVALMLSAMQRNRQSQSSQSLLPLLLQPLQFQEVWIALQPSLTALYIQQWFPGLQRRILGIVGPKRVQLWREGLDLYDPASWRRQTKTSASSNVNDSVNVNGNSDNVNGNNGEALVGNVNNNKANNKDE
jgi:short-subunit dehydrogenase